MLLKSFVPLFIKYRYNVISIIIYIITDIVSSNTGFIIPIIFVIIITDIISNNIPIITEMNELALCFTTSVLFSASNLGYFRLTISPIKCETRGINTDNINNSIDSIMLILNLIISIIFPINNTGVVNSRLE